MSTEPTISEAAEPAPEPIEGEAAEPASEAPAAEAAPTRSWADTLAYLQKVDPDAYTHAKGMQADYTRKTQAAAAQRKELDARQAALDAQQARIDQLMQGLGAPDGELPEYDPYKKESVLAHTRRELYEKHIKPLEEQAAQQKAALDYQQLAREHEDVMGDPEKKAELVTLMQQNTHYRLVDGIEIIRARHVTRSRTSAAERARIEREANRAAALQGTAPARRQQARVKAPPKQELRKMSNADILALSKELDQAR